MSTSPDDLFSTILRSYVGSGAGQIADGPALAGALASLTQAITAQTQTNAALAATVADVAGLKSRVTTLEGGTSSGGGTTTTPSGPFTDIPTITVADHEALVDPATPSKVNVSIVAAAVARTGQSARWHLAIDSNQLATGERAQVTVTVGGTADAGDFDRSHILALWQAGTRYDRSKVAVDLASDGLSAVVTIKPGAPVTLEVAVQCKRYHRRDGDRTITYHLAGAAGCAITAADATTSLVMTGKAKTSLADFLTDFPATLLFDGSAASQILNASGQPAAVGDPVAQVVLPGGWTFAPGDNQTMPIRTAKGLHFDGVSQQLAGACPALFQQQCAASPGFSVFAICTLDSPAHWTPVVGILASDNSDVGFLGTTDDGTFGYRNAAGGKRARPLETTPTVVYSWQFDEISATAWSNEDDTSATRADADLSTKSFSPAQVLFGMANPGYFTLGAGELLAFALVPAVLNTYERQRFAQLLGANFGISDVTCWPLLDLSGLGIDIYHNACLTADPMTVDARGFNQNWQRGEYNHYGSYQIYQAQTKGFSLWYNFEDVRELAASSGVPPLIERTDDPAGGLLLKIVPCPSAFQPYTRLVAANADPNMYYSTGVPGVGDGGAESARHLVAHVDTMNVCLIPGGARIIEYVAPKSCGSGAYSAIWSGTPQGWITERDTNEYGLGGNQPAIFGTNTYWSRVEGRDTGDPSPLFLPGYRLESDEYPSCYVELISADRLHETLYIDGVQRVRTFAVEPTQISLPMYQIVNTDTESAQGIGGKDAPDGLTDQGTLLSVRFLQYGSVAPPITAPQQNVSNSSDSPANSSTPTNGS